MHQNTQWIVFPSLSAVCQRDNYLYSGGCLPFRGFCCDVSTWPYRWGSVCKLLCFQTGLSGLMREEGLPGSSEFPLGPKPAELQSCLLWRCRVQTTSRSCLSFCKLTCSLYSPCIFPPCCFFLFSLWDEGDPCSGLGLLPSVPITSSSICSVTYFSPFWLFYC